MPKEVVEKKEPEVKDRVVLNAPPEESPNNGDDPPPLMPDMYQTAAEVTGTESRHAYPERHIPGLTHSPGLRSVRDSIVPGHTHSHVKGPMQSPVDPIAAGLSPVPVPSVNETRVTTDGDGHLTPNALEEESDDQPGMNSAAPR